MARRGRPRHPDVFTPREWDVLALLREGLTNEQIAQRLEITERTAKFHVSEILSKLGVSSRQEAAAWQPQERRPWWLAIGSPLSFLWRKSAGGLNAFGLAIGGAMFAAVVAGIALLALLLPRGGSSSSMGTNAMPRIAFSAGGSIYTIAPDGTGLRQVSPGAAPAIAPDGSRIGFIRDLDIWTAGADGSNVHRLAEVRDLQTPPDHAASNWSLGAQSVAWSPDGKHIAYVMGRIGGSGIQDVWVMRSDGSERTRVYHGGGPWVQPAWVDNERLALYEAHGRLRVFRLAGEEETSISLPAEQRYSIAAIAAPGGNWLVGPLINEGPVMYGQADALRQIASGVAPAISPDAQQVAYLRGDSLRVIAVDGTGDHEVANLTPLGRRDHHFAEQPACFPNRAPSCGYIPPEISWVGMPTASMEATPTVPIPSGTQMSGAQVRPIVSALFADDATRVESLLRFERVPCTKLPVGPGAPPECRSGEVGGTPVEVFPVARCEGFYARPDALQDVINVLANPGPQVVSVYQYHPIDINPNPFLYADFVAVVTFGAAAAPRNAGGVWIGNGGITGVDLGCAQTPSEFAAFWNLQNPIDLGP